MFNYHLPQLCQRVRVIECWCYTLADLLGVVSTSLATPTQIGDGGRQLEGASGPPRPRRSGRRWAGRLSTPASSRQLPFPDPLVGELFGFHPGGQHPRKLGVGIGSWRVPPGRPTPAAVGGGRQVA